MSDLVNRCLEAFPQWLGSLGDDTVALCSLLTAESIPDRARRHVAGSVNYVCKSLDLIPDGVEDLGYLDDAFVLRIACRLALRDDPAARQADIRGLLARLAHESALIEELLEAEYPRLEKYVRALEKGAARGRLVDEIVNDAGVRSEVMREVQSWARNYSAPSFTTDEKTLIKLRSFFAAKLP
ncbi:MAG: DUF1232 domain-containing protein [Polyangiaceae bacterium]|jgi:uncharacterized membrane protein YkvA (DUF1232 family)|nr:DUF1232 domain-containing protein [Polyangiaceae bacterium]